MKRIFLILAISLAASAQSPAGPCNDGDAVVFNLSTQGFRCTTKPLVPTGTTLVITSGTCPSGFSENTDLNGKMLRGTLAANGNVGTSGGADSITPTVASLTAAAQTISGSTASESAHTHSVTSNVAQNAFTNPTIAWPAGVPTNASGAFTQGAMSWPAGVPTNAAVTAGTPAGTISALTTGADSSTTGGVAKAIAQTPTFTGSALGTHTHTISWPAGVPTIAAGVFTQPTVSWPAGVPTASGGSVSLTNNAVTSAAGSAHSHAVGTLANAASAVTGTLNSFDNRPAYLNVIFCKAN